MLVMTLSSSVQLVIQTRSEKMEIGRHRCTLPGGH